VSLLVFRCGFYVGTLTGSELVVVVLELRVRVHEVGVGGVVEIGGTVEWLMVAAKMSLQWKVKVWHLKVEI